MAIVNHGDEKFELPLLWRLCTAMVDFGYPVAVLDATTMESESNPGLEQLLEYDFWRGQENTEIPAWSVVPSACGLQSLCGMLDRKEQSLQHLGQLFPNEGVIILYGKAQWLAPLLASSGVKPLLAVAPMKSSLLSSYVALKHLLLNGRLEPTIVNLIQDRQAPGNPALRSVATTLTDCARNFLGFEVNALNIVTSPDDDQPRADLQHLALRMIEDGVPLKHSSMASVAHTRSADLRNFTRGH